MTDTGDASVSQHPADRLIRDLIRTGRPVTEEEVGRIIERLASAPFDPRTVPVGVRQRGLVYRRVILGARADSVAYHLAQRVLQDKQWAPGTTADQYLDDLRRGVRASSRLLVYHRRGGAIAATVTPTDDVVPVTRRGSRALANLLVIYAADRGTIISGYQFSALDKIGIPQEARWLR